jgi:uncharacterized membrane protein
MGFLLGVLVACLMMKFVYWYFNLFK